MRKGLGKGLGKGYRNLINVYDSQVHSLSARGIRRYRVNYIGLESPESDLAVDITYDKQKYGGYIPRTEELSAKGVKSKNVHIIGKSRIGDGSVIGKSDFLSGFQLVKKTYQDEDYEKEATFEGKKIGFDVRMGYHTFLKYWDVGYYWTYGDRMSTPPIKGVRAENRKDARRIAHEWMKSANVKDIETMRDAEFYKKRILEEG